MKSMYVHLTCIKHIGPTCIASVILEIIKYISLMVEQLHDCPTFQL